MKKLFIAFFLCLLPTIGFAQSQRNPCFYPNDYPNSGCVPVGTSSPLPVTGSVTIVGPDGPEGGVSVSINPFREDATNHAGTVTVGGAWQQIAPANALRQRFFLENYCSAATQGLSASESIFIAIRPDMPPTSPLVAPTGSELVTCGSYDTSSAVVSVSPVWVWASSTGHRFQALEW